MCKEEQKRQVFPTKTRETRKTRFAASEHSPPRRQSVSPVPTKEMSSSLFFFSLSLSLLLFDSYSRRAITPARRYRRECALSLLKFRRETTLSFPREKERSTAEKSSYLSSLSLSLSGEKKKKKKKRPLLLFSRTNFSLSFPLLSSETTTTRARATTKKGGGGGET